MQPSQSNWNFPDFPPVPLLKPELLKLTIKWKLKLKLPSWSKKSNIFPRILRVVMFLAWFYVKPPDFKQLNWRIRENLSQAINNGSWYKLSLLVSKDAMIVPATCIYSVWRFALNSLDMSPWYKYYYFQFYKLGIGKVINRLNLSCAPLTL